MTVGNYSWVVLICASALPDRQCANDPSAETLAGSTGFSNRLIIDIQKFLAASFVTNENVEVSLSKNPVSIR